MTCHDLVCFFKVSLPQELGRLSHNVTYTSATLQVEMSDHFW